MVFVDLGHGPHAKKGWCHVLYCWAGAQGLNGPRGPGAVHLPFHSFLSKNSKFSF